MHRLGFVILLLCAAIGGARAADPPPKYVVFFQEWSAALDEPAQAVISQAAEWVKAHAGETVRVSGFASPAGSRESNILLSDLRAQVVVDQLVADGVDASRLLQRGQGPVQYALTALESRRVEISVGGH